MVKVLNKLKIDDPLDAFAVHYGGGFCGVLLTPIFMIGGIIDWTGCDSQLDTIKVFILDINYII